ncbi:hypothetical protein IM817_11475 [Serratia marcescens]|uniref:hypothetical protein n=1 Tax=Serratia marcescens TaxID=615 RepID=UPI001C56F1BE|nr:hypothetical protein [Serratia marcescens]QXX99349.1 hypothetical protein IM817_11475 [Serratia marcescens]
MTLTTTEELKHLASSDNTNELTRRLARECLANREAQPVMWAHERKLSNDVAITKDEVVAAAWKSEGLSVTPLYTAPPATAVPDGFKLMPLEMTDDIGEAIAMEARCSGGIALCIYEAALAAAPGVGMQKK